MLASPISRSPDLRRLKEEGYDLSLLFGFLVVRQIPFVDDARKVGVGKLIVPLDMAGDRTVSPTVHAVWWAGGAPCDSFGHPLAKIIQFREARRLGTGLHADTKLCNRPSDREFADYHELVTAYVNLITGHAVALQPGATARRNRTAVADENPVTPFRYLDTATARAGIGECSARLEGGSVAIIGVGGTGSYVLDLVAKTPVRSIHLFDADTFDQHNAFRAPGAPSLADIAARRAKVDHFAAIYSRMHRGIIPHRVKLGRENLKLLDGIDFAFICSDDSASKLPIIGALEKRGASFIDVGMGLEIGEGGLGGMSRVTTSTPEMRDHVRKEGRVPFTPADEVDAYATNIQVADLNALNAALAVLKWKRLRGFYADTAREHHSLYVLSEAMTMNEDRLGP